MNYRKVIGCAIEVHRNPGPGLLESAYKQCLAREFSIAEFSFEIQKFMPVEYKGVQLDCGYFDYKTLDSKNRYAYNKDQPGNRR
ncbi:GxxExxY protein [candidate division KSB1 bacterium]|nr:GxxExxY protein [candidate division KSB1 bacterium]